MKKIIFSTDIDEMWSYEDRIEFFNECKANEGEDFDYDFDSWSMNEFDNMISDNLEELRPIEECILVGKLGRWNGNFDAHMFIKNIDDLTRAMNNFDYVCIYTESGKTYFKASDHDGSSLFELKKIRSKYDFENVRSKKEGDHDTDRWSTYFGSINDKKLRKILGWM